MMTQEMNNMELNNNELTQVTGGGFCIGVGYGKYDTACIIWGTNDTWDGYGHIGSYDYGYGAHLCSGFGYGFGFNF